MNSLLNSPGRSLVCFVRPSHFVLGDALHVLGYLSGFGVRQVPFLHENPCSRIDMEK